MLGRLFEKFFVFLLVLALLSAAVQVLVCILQRVTAALGCALPKLLGSMLTSTMLGAFGVGLLVRLRRWLRERSELQGRRAGDVWRARTAARRPAEDVPAHVPPPEPPEDPDPALRVHEEE